MGSKLVEFFNSYQAKIRFSQIMKIDMIQTQDIFEYLDRELNYHGINDERDVSPAEIDEAYDTGYEDGWDEAVSEIESAIPSRYGHSRRRR